MSTIIDSHTHLFGDSSIDTHMDNALSCNHAAIGIACCIDRDRINDNPQAFACKAVHPSNVYVFAGLDHQAAEKDLPLSGQVQRLLEIGVDGIKLIESKPTSRQLVDKPMNSPYYRDFFSAVEEAGLPLLWHVADPGEFWNAELLPAWAQSKGWGYDEKDVTKEALYEEVEDVLAEHPKLAITFAHFYFLSADLDRAADFLERHPNVSIDLAPGVEMLYNISADPVSGRSFFTRYADRIIYGTDIFSSLSKAEARSRSGLVRRWLESDETFTVASDADFLLGKPEDGVIHGLALDGQILDTIYRDNFVRRCGATPRKFDPGLAIEECERIGVTARDSTEADRALSILRNVS